MGDKDKIGNLKSKLDGNRLDLSLCELVTVPTKEILDLKKVTDLDLSRNRLSTLSADFCNLTNLTALDLSSNFLRSLPERFGSLHNLQRLDLYKNQLTDLPLTFCQLKKLKWIDLKDNCLNDSLRIVAGDFSSEKDCRQAATQVVQYMQRLQSDHERERQKRLFVEREAEAAKKAKEEAERKLAQNEKKKQKEKKKTPTNVQTNKRHADDVSNNRQSQNSTDIDNNTKHRPTHAEVRKAKRGTGKCMKLLFKFFLCLLFAPVVLASLIFVNCASTEREILPKSRNLCHDVYFLMSTGRFQSTWDYHETYKQVKIDTKNFSDHVIQEISNFDYQIWLSKLNKRCSEFQQSLKPTLNSAIEKSNRFFDWFLKEADVWSTKFLKSALVIADRTYKIGSEAAQWSIDTGRDFVQNYPTYWEKVKFYWKNMK